MQLQPRTKKILKIIIALIAWVAVFFTIAFIFGGCAIVYANPGDIIENKIETNHTILYYHNHDDLVLFNKQIRFSSKPVSGFSWILPETTPKDLKGAITQKVDALFERVQEILDMHEAIKKVRINIYSDHQQLCDVYLSFFMKINYPRAWYLFEYNTIYVNVKDVNENVLAHEMGHSIVDNYLKPCRQLPSASGEILSRYVDTHLYKK